MSHLQSGGLRNGAGGTLYLSERHSDIAIIVENGDNVLRFPAHSLFLRSMSEVISNMLESDMSEKSTKKITITDSNATTIKQFLRYLYTGEVTVGEWREVVELLSIAHKYQVFSLINICEKMLLDSLSLPSVCFLYDVAQLYSLHELQFQAQKLILDGGFVVLCTEGFENLCKKSVEFFLSSRYLNVENEISVLHAVRRWAMLECCRRGQKLSKANILAVMESMLHHVRLSSIEPRRMRFIPDTIIQNHSTTINDISRVKFFVPASLHERMASLKFVVELGSFIQKSCATEPLTCLKFSADSHFFILGFRIVGMFRNNFTFGSGNPMLILSRENNKLQSVQFDLSSVPWKGGSVVGDYIWKEVVAYFPQPARVAPYMTHSLTIKYGNILPTKWPRTRIETNNLNTEMGPIVLYTFGQCSGVTELFLLQAPSVVDSCDDIPQ